jgi:acetyl-CoA C-acetyltransferase
MARPDPARIPVIIGIGEVKDRPADPAQGLEPMALMAEALRRAEADAGSSLLPRLDALAVVNEVSWPYVDLVGLLCERLGIAPRHREYGPVGGETPVRFLHEAAERISRGESAVAAVCGGEAQYTVAQAQKAGIALPWTPKDPNAKPRTREYLAELARRHGIDQPIKVYPLYENATQAAWGQTPEQGQAESARLWAMYSEAASRNPDSWIAKRYSAEEIATPSAGNRMISWPYPKLMVANPLVNQGCAVLLASLEVARAAGIPDHRIVHLRGGAAADEPKDYMRRPHFNSAPAMDVVLETALEMAGGDASRFAAREFYSCFPCVPKMARRKLGLPEDAPPTVAGGLTFHGAPLNNYMLHAAAGMVRELRGAAPGTLGLLYGQGGFVTQHRSLVLGAGGETDHPLVTLDRQAEADRRRAAAPEIVEGHTGAATVETHTVVFRTDGTPDYGAVVLRLPDGARTMARVPREDTATLDVLMAPQQSAVGLKGRLAEGREGLQEWRI